MNTMNSSKQEDDSGGGFGGDHNTVSNLANGIYRIDVAHENDHNVGSTSSFEDEKKSNNGISGNGMVIGTAIATSSVAASSMSNNTYAKAASSASANNNNNNNQVGVKYKQNCSNDMEDDCDRSQSSISGASWDAHGRRSSFRSRVGKVYSPRWMDQETSRLDASNNQQSSSYYSETTHVHRRMASSDGYLTDVERMTKRRASRESSETVQHNHNQMNDSASHASHHTHEDSHDEGYLSHSTAEGYQSGGYHSYHPALSYAASVKSDIATVCSGSVVEDIDMAEMASVASDGARKSAAPQHHQAGKDEAKLKNVEFASNILNDMVRTQQSFLHSVCGANYINHFPQSRVLILYLLPQRICRDHPHYAVLFYLLPMQHVSQTVPIVPLGLSTMTVMLCLMLLLMLIRYAAKVLCLIVSLFPSLL